MTTFYMPVDIRIRALLIFLVFANGTLTAGYSHAETASTPQFRFSGYTTLGLVKGGDEELGFIQSINQEGVFDGDISFKSNSNLGLQLDAIFNQRLSAGVQLLVRDRLDYDVEDAINWAFIRYRFSPDWTLRAGRVGQRMYMLSDYRNIGFAYLWARPPGEFYTVQAFDSVDGLELTYSTGLGSGTLTSLVLLGQSKNTFAQRGEEYTVKLSPTVTTVVSWENDLWQTNFALALVEFDNSRYFPGSEPLVAALSAITPYWPAAQTYQDSLIVEGKKTLYSTVGVGFTPEKWQIQSEFSFADTDTSLGELASGYISVGYHIGTTTPYIMYAETRNKAGLVQVETPTPTGIPMLDYQLALTQFYTQSFYNALNLEQNTTSLGLRWNVRYDLALKAQWDHSRVSANGGGLWDQKAIPTENKNLNTYTINLNYVF